MSFEKQIYRDFPVRPEPAYSFEQTPIQNLLDGPVMRSFGEFPGGHADTAIVSSHSLYPRSAANAANQKLGHLEQWAGIDGFSTPSTSFGMGSAAAAFGQKFEGKLGPSTAVPSYQTTGPFLDISQLDPVPVYYEKYSSFYTQSSPEFLLKDIHRILTGMEGVDHDLKPSKCKIKGYANGVTGRCAFKVQLFWNQGASVLCEFQRRSGCVVSFNKFWKKALGSLANHVPTMAESTMTSVNDSAETLPLPPGLVDSTPSVLERDIVERLVAMAGCDNVDVQREGSAALASISQSTAQPLVDSLPQLIPLVDKLMLANDEELCRNACVFLANLCVLDACRAEVVKKLLSNMLSLLTEPGHMGRRDSKRHVARALFECSKASCGVRALAPHVNVLQGYRNAQDMALQESIRGTLAHLKVS